MTSTTAAAAGDAPGNRATSPVAIVAAAGLPSELGELVLAVTGRCKLWRSERCDVARELCSHFREGLDAGDAPSGLLTAFGDPAVAARLICSAKKRARPLWWRTARVMTLAAGAAIATSAALYGVLAARFYWAEPKLTHNYSAEYNATVLATPAEQRAWPAYLEALVALGEAKPDLFNGGEPASDQEPGWADWLNWLDAHQNLLAKVHTAADKPHLGVTMSQNLSPEYLDMLNRTGRGFNPAPQEQVENPMMLGILLPHLGEMRRLARFVATDLHAAARAGDRPRLMRDFRTLARMGDQCMEGRTLIDQLVGLAIYTLAMDAVDKHAADRAIFDDATLVELADQVRALNGGRFTLDFAFERDSMDDLIQRFYSDNGSGDGHFVHGPHFDAMYRDFGLAVPTAMPLLKAFQPIQSVLLPSRAEMKDLIEGVISAANTSEQLPLWRHTERKADEAYKKLAKSGLYTIAPVIESLQGGSESPLGGAFRSRDLAEAMRDALLVKIALQRYHLAHSAWPSSLEVLVPTLLTSVPLDPFDGKPLRYRFSGGVNDTPVLYSVGVDGVDGGGVAPPTKDGRAQVSSTRMWAILREGAKPVAEEARLAEEARFDWVLWPEPAPLPEQK